MSRTSVLVFIALAACSPTAPSDGPDMQRAPVDMAHAPIPHSQGVGVNDVSVLFPLPTDSTGTNALLSLSSMGAGGSLLSEAQFNELLPFQQSGRTYAEFRIVAARIDPCFPSLSLLASNPSACRRELRLVAQPLTAVDGLGNEQPDLALGAADAGIHLLFDLDEASFAALARAWLALGTTTTHDRSLPLGTHPTLTNEGLTGPTTAAFEALITKYAGPSTLFRVTSMNGLQNEWQFMGLEATASGLVPIVIHGVPSNATSAGGTRVKLEASALDDGPFDSDAATAEFTALRPLGGREALNTNGQIGGHVVFDAPADAIQKAFALSYRVDDPTDTFNADTLDCTSCHVAGRARSFAFSNGVAPDMEAGYLNAARDLSVPSNVASTITQQRAFGYRGTTAVFTQRAVNESAAVADVLEAMVTK